MPLYSPISSPACSSVNPKRWIWSWSIGLPFPHSHSYWFVGIFVADHARAALHPIQERRSGELQGQATASGGGEKHSRRHHGEQLTQRASSSAACPPSPPATLLTSMGSWPAARHAAAA